MASAAYRWMMFGGLFLLVLGCSKSSDEPGNPNLEGVWEVTSGELWSLPGGLVSDVGTSRFLDLSAPSSDSGSGTLFGLHASGVVGCAPILYAQLNESTLTLFAPKADETAPLRAYIFEVEGDTLTLTDAEGVVTTLTRGLAAVPTAFSCETLQTTSTVDLAETPEFFSGIAYDGLSLWSEAADEFIYPVDPTSGALGTGVDSAGGEFGQYSHVLALEGSDFWLHCGCGGSEEIHRVSSAGVLVDAVDTDVDLASSLSVRGAAFDGASLWVAGFSRAPGITTQILEVDASGEPDVLIQAIAFQSRIDSFGLNGNDLWVLTEGAGAVAAQIDPDTGEAVRTITLPDDYRWGGLTFIDGDMILLGSRNSDGAGVIRRAAL